MINELCVVCVLRAIYVVSALKEQKVVDDMIENGTNRSSYLPTYLPN